MNDWKREQIERDRRHLIRKTMDAARRRAAILADLHWSGSSSDNIPSEFVDSREKERPSDSALNGDNPAGSAVRHEVLGGADMRGCDRISDRPSSFEPITDKLPGASEFVRPLGCSQPLAIVLYPYVCRCVVGLLRRCGPSAIFGAIPLFAVNPVNARPIWARPHVGEKVFKGEPSVADAKPLSSVTPIVLGVRVKASLLDPSPYLVDRVIVHPVFFPGTATRVCPAERGAVHDNLFSAVANAVPSYRPADAFRKTNCRQRPIPQSSAVNNLFHFVTSKLLTVMGAWQSAVRPFFGSYPSHAG